MRFSLLIVFLSLLVLSCSTAKKTVTVILIRHAEKDTSLQVKAMMTSNPPLSKEGEARAVRLVDALKSYNTDMIYATDFLRTKQTVTPLALQLQKDIEVYDANKMDAFAEKLVAQKGKTIVVAGHSNTTPALVNLLIKEKKYPSLNDNVYNKIFVVTLTDDKTEVKEFEY